MGLVGSLEDLGLGDILQIVSLSRKSGLLNLGWGEVKGKIFFNDGQVVAAVVNNRNASLGSLLSSKGKLDAGKAAAVDQVVSTKADAPGVRSRVVSEFGVASSEYDDVIRDHIEETVFGFFSWPEGTFSFELQEIEADIAALEPPDNAFVLEVGLSPQFLAMEGTRIQDEARRGITEAPVGPPLKGSHKSAEQTHADEADFSSLSDSDAPAAAPAPEPEASEPEAAAPEPTAADQSAGEPEFSSVADALAFYDQAGGQGNSDDAAGGIEEISAGAETPEPAAPAPEAEPVPLEEAGPAAASSPESAQAADEPPSSRKGRVLMVVDDDPFMLKSLQHHLGKKGHNVATFNDVQSAVARIQEMVDLGEKPRLVVSDLIMPDTTGGSTLGGLELLESVKGANPSIPVYMMTDYENLPARARSEELGARHFFMKPKSSQLDEDFSSPELVNFVAVLENALDSEKAPSKGGAIQEDDDGMINLGEELRREFGEEVMPSSSETEAVVPSPGLHMLKNMISELNDPAMSGQITLLILRFAAEMMNRAVIFLVAKNKLAGLGQFGIELDGEDPQKHVRKMRIPLNEPSIFREAIQKRLPLKKALKPNKWNQYLVDELGGQKPQEVFVAPIIAGGKIAALLYGDNVPEDKEVGDTESLEIFLAQAGLAMEKALLERRLREVGSSGHDSG